MVDRVAARAETGPRSRQAEIATVLARICPINRNLLASCVMNNNSDTSLYLCDYLTLFVIGHSCEWWTDKFFVLNAWCIARIRWVEREIAVFCEHL